MPLFSFVRGLPASLQALETDLKAHDIAAATRRADALKPELTGLLAALAGAMRSNDARVAALRQRATDLSAQVDNIKAEIDGLTAKINTADGQIAQLQATGNLRQADVIGLTATVTALSAGLQARQDRLNELKSWFWVPGYGAYLSIRTLVDHDIDGLATARQDLSTMTGRLRDGETALAQASTLLTDLQRQAAGMHATQTQLGVIRDRANGELTTAVARTAFLNGATTWLGTLRAMTENIDSGILPEVSDALARLNAGTTLRADQTIFNRKVTLFSGALAEIAYAIDHGGDVLTFAPPSGNVITLTNRGAFLVSFHAEWRDDAGVPRRSLDVGDFAVLQTGRLDLRPLGIADLAEVTIVMEPRFGDTRRSAPILFIRQPEDETAHFTAGGTIFDAQLSHDPATAMVPIAA